MDTKVDCNRCHQRASDQVFRASAIPSAWEKPEGLPGRGSIWVTPRKVSMRDGGEGSSWKEAGHEQSDRVERGDVHLGVGSPLTWLPPGP